jgi:hypothetical protein
VTTRPSTTDAILIALVFIAAFSVPIVGAVIHSGLRSLGITLVVAAAAAATFLVLREPLTERD